MADIVQRVVPELGGVLNSPLLRIGLTTIAVSAAIAWVASAWWCYRDNRHRTADPLAPYLSSGLVLLASPLLFPLAIGLYMLVRPQETSRERDLRLLARTALSSVLAEIRCPGCGGRTDRRWVRCPECATALARSCGRCGRTMDATWSICPWCAANPAQPVPPAARRSTGARSAGERSAEPAVVGWRNGSVDPTPVPTALNAASAAAAALAGGGPRVLASAPADGPAGFGSQVLETVASLVARHDGEPTASRLTDEARPIAMGPGRAIDGWAADAQARTMLVEPRSPRRPVSMKRLRAVREGVRTTRSLGVRRPVTGARAVQSSLFATAPSVGDAGPPTPGDTRVAARVVQP